MRRTLLLLLLLAACKRGGKRAPDAAVFSGYASPPFEIQLELTGATAVVAMPDGGAVVGLSIEKPITIAGTTFTPQRGKDALVVALAPDGQPRAAVSFGLDGVASARIVDLARQADGTVRVGLVTSGGLPRAHGSPSDGPGGGGEMYTLATVDLAKGVTDEIAIGTVGVAAPTALAALPDGGAIVARSGSYTQDASPASVVTRVSASGERIWEQRHDARVVDGIAADGDEILVLVSEPTWSGAITLAADGTDTPTRCGRERGAGERGHTDFAWKAAGTWHLIGGDQQAVHHQVCGGAVTEVIRRVGSVLAVAPPRAVVRILAGDVAPGLYAVRLDGGAPVPVAGPDKASHAAVLADGGVLVVGSCATGRGCLVRSNP